MKRLALFVILNAIVLFPVLKSEGAEPKNLESRITAVAVYLDHALITRQGEAVANVGKQEFVLPLLPSEIKDSSIRIKVSGASLIGSHVQSVFLERESNSDVRKLQDELQKLKDQQQVVNADLAILSSELTFLRSLQTSTPKRINGQLAAAEVKLPDAGAYRQILDFIVQGLKKNSRERIEATKKLRQFSPRIAAKEQELRDKRSGGALARKNIVVNIESAGGGKVLVSVSYLLPGAMWYPSYDVRADRKKGLVDLVYYGVIQQATGEDWNNVVLTLSATSPLRPSTRPRAVPWVLGGTPEIIKQTEFWAANNSSQMIANLPINNDVQISRQFGHRGKGMRKFHQRLMANEFQVRRVLKTITARGTSVAIPVKKRETVLTDGKQHRVLLSRDSFKLNCSYSVVPELSLATYVTGKARNTSVLPLLPGQASVYLGGDLIGSSNVRFIAKGETAEFHLGVEDSIKVTRKLDSRLSSVRRSGKRRRVNMSYSIKVENFGKKEAVVTVEEALPVTQESSVKIRIARFETKPVHSEMGITRWQLRLPAEGSQTIKISYSIDAPLVIRTANKSKYASPAQARGNSMDRAVQWINANK
jgi:uncharacterized protein (TIGR02231 family)